MAQARRRNKRETGAANGLPGWAMLTIGLIIGLFVAFLVYLDDLEEPPNAAVESSESASGSDAGKTSDGQDSGSTEDGNQSDGNNDPRFEFYSILPELEVVVPEQGAQGDESTGTTRADETSTEGEGRFYLQAGSFQQADQAEGMKAEIALLGLDVAIQSVEIDGERWHRVRVGPYDSRRDLESARSRLRDNGIDFLVLREKAGG